MNDPTKPMRPPAPQSQNPKDIAARKKIPIWTFPSAGIIAGARGCAYGAFDAPNGDKQGYGPYNWRDQDISLVGYISAIMRHCMSLLDGQDLDTLSKLHHIDHVIATGGIITDARECGALLDDRPKTQREGPAPRLLLPAGYRPTST